MNAWLAAATMFLAFAPFAPAQEKPAVPDATPQVAVTPQASAAPQVAAAPQVSTAPAGQTSASPAPAAFSSGHETDGMLRMIGMLVLIAALLGGAVYFLKSGGFVMLQRGSKGARKLSISETRMLGNRQFLVVAEYEEKKMLIGVCPGRIDYLCPLGSGEETFSTVLPQKPE